MKRAGIWMDRKKAVVVELLDDKVAIRTLLAKVEDFKAGGGSGTRPNKWGPQDVVHDSKYLERRKHQMRSFFKEIVQDISNADELVIFGPAQTGYEFAEYLKEKFGEISNKVQSVEKGDSMTDNQVAAWVRNFFEQKLDKS